MGRSRSSLRAHVLATDDPSDLTPPRLPRGADVGWAVSELFEALWLASGRDPAELKRSLRGRREAETG